MEHDREKTEIGELSEAPEVATDRYNSPLQKRSSGILPWGAALLIIAALAWLLYPEAELPPDPALESSPAQVPPALAALPPSPDIPLTEPLTEQEPVTDPAATPVPILSLKLEDSDVAVRQALASGSNSELTNEALQHDDLLQRGSVLIDGLSRGLVLQKSLPMARPAGSFATRSEPGRQVIDPANYGRYDAYARAVGLLDTGSLVSAFHKFRPLLEEAYGQLGYDETGLDNALIRSLDVVIATPEIQGEIAVSPKGGIYLFADPELESLAQVQKLLLRMGPENRMLVRGQAEALRAALLGAAGE